MDRLDQHALALALRLVEFVQPRLERLDQRRDDERHHDGETKHNQRQLHAVKQQERNENDEAEQLEHRKEQIPGKEAADLLGLLHMLQQHAGRHALEKLDRQPHEVPEGLRRRRNIDLVGREKQQIVPQVFETCIEQDRRDDADAEHVQRLIRIVDQHLVDDDLEKERRDQRDRVDHEHGHGDLSEKSPQLQELRDEPAQPERLLFVGQLVDPLHKQPLPGRNRLERLALRKFELLARVFGVDSMTEEEEAAQREKMELVEASVKGYENISCYSIEGPEPDSYVIFPYFEIRFRETNVRMPQLTWGYARKGADGQYYIEAKADEEIQACIALAGQQEDAARLIKQVKQQQQAAVESDAYLQEIYGGAAASEVVIEGKQE